MPPATREMTDAAPTIDLEAPVIGPVIDGLRAWAEPLVDPAHLSFDAPRPEPAEAAGVSIHLLTLGRRQTFQGSLPPALEAEARFLVTSWGPDSVAAAETLTRLLFAAMDRPDLEVELEPPAADTWPAFGVRPQPSFELRVPLRKERAVPPVKRVLHPLKVEKAALIPMHGRLSANEGIAVSGADITLLPAGPTIRTGDDGTFTFGAVPASGTRRLEVRAKGRRLSLALEPLSDPTASYEITIDLLEG